jgi:hypothetical protein
MLSTLCAALPGAVHSPTSNALLTSNTVGQVGCWPVGVCPTTTSKPSQHRAKSYKDVMQAVSTGLLPARVIGVGLPHTGTTYLHEMLSNQLGCLYSSHNLRSTNQSAMLWTWAISGDECEEKASECEEAVVDEARHFQCVTDDPWSSHWRALAADDPSSIVVLTRSLSALHYAITVKEWLNRTRWGQDVRRTSMLLGPDPTNLTHAMQAYEAHNQAVRDAFANYPNFVEFCAQCGEDVRTLARRLNVRGLATMLRQLPSGVAVRLNAHPSWEAQERRRLITEYAEALAHV